MGLDPSQLLKTLDPNDRHASIMAVLPGQDPPVAQPFDQPRCKQQAAPPAGLWSGAPPASSGLCVRLRLELGAR